MSRGVLEPSARFLELKRDHATHDSALRALQVEEIRRIALEDEFDKLREIARRQNRAYRYLGQDQASFALFDFECLISIRLSRMYLELQSVIRDVFL